MRTLVLLIALLTLTLQSCGSDEDQVSSKLNSSFESLQLELVSKSQWESSKLLRSVGVIMLGLQDPSDPGVVAGIPYCSAFRVSPDLILTAAHCAKGPTMIYFEGYVASSSDAQLELMNLGGTLRVDSFAATVKEVGKADVENPLGEPLYINKKTDIAIYRAPTKSENYIDISHAVPEVATLELLSYPNGVPLTIASDCEIKGKYKGMINHDCDAFTGSSGGLLVDKVTGAPVGMHHRGPGVNDYDSFQTNKSFGSADSLAKKVCEKQYQLVAGMHHFDECYEHYLYNKATTFDQILPIINSLISSPSA